MTVFNFPKVGEQVRILPSTLEIFYRIYGCYMIDPTLESTVKVLKFESRRMRSKDKFTPSTLNDKCQICDIYGVKKPGAEHLVKLTINVLNPINAIFWKLMINNTNGDIENCIGVSCVILNNTLYLDIGIDSINNNLESINEYIRC